MQKILIITVLFCCCWGLKAQQAATSPEKKSRRAADKEKADFVKPSTVASKAAAPQLAGQWRQQALANPQNAQSWLQWGLWTWRSGNALNPATAGVANIYQQAGSHIAGSGEYLLLQFLQSNKTDSAAIYGALDKITDKRTVYPFIIHYDIIRNNGAQLRKHCLAFQQLQPLVKNGALYRYHYNVLQSAPANATIAAAGENDLVPLAMMQAVHGIRTDIRLQYLQSASLQGKPATPVYICLSAGEGLLRAYREKLVYHGLLAQVSSVNDPAAALRADMLDMNYLEGEVFTGLQAELHNNYLPSLLLAYSYYYKMDAAKAAKYKKLILKISAEGGRLTAVEAELQKTELNGS